MERLTSRSMIHGENNMIYGLDTETDHDGEKAWIVQWCLHNGKKAKTGTDLESLKIALIKLGNRKKGKHYIYVHNLKYDLAFFKYAIYEISLEYDGEITPIIRKNNPISITLKFQGKTIIFRDSFKKWQGHLSSMGKAYGIEKLESPSEFYPGWSNDVDLEDPENWKYVIRDAEIVAVAMQQQHKSGASKATTSGDAWKDMHAVINGKKYIPGKNKWLSLFPPLDYELDCKHRAAYFGGINMSFHRGSLITGEITHEDRVSMYPSIMYGTENEKLPYGKPIYIGTELPPEDELYVTKQRIKLKLKKNHIPWFFFKTGYDYVMEDMSYGDPVVETTQWHELTLSSVDLDNLNLDYEIEMDPLYASETWLYKSKVGILRPYVEKWIKAKQEAPKESAEREHAKRMLNAAYGRFALIQETEKISLLEDPDYPGELYWRSQLSVEGNDGYLPMAIFITAYARRRLMDRVRQVCEIYGASAIIHGDTDSVIYKGKPIGGNSEELGGWSLEGCPQAIYEGGFKRYIEYYGRDKDNNPIFKMACAGVPQRYHHKGYPIGMHVELLDDPSRILDAYTLGNEKYKIKSKWLRNIYKKAKADPDNVNTLKLIPVNVPGGVILEGRQHELSDNLKWRFNRAL